MTVTKCRTSGYYESVGYSSAEGINDAGKVVGTSSIGAHEGESGFLYDGSGMQNIGGGSAIDINNSDQIARTACEGGVPCVQACLYQNGQKTYLGTLGGDQSYAHGLNNLGKVVGRSDAWTQWGYNRPQAFLYELHDQEGAHMHDIRPSQNSSDSWALDVNDNDTVLGFHRDGSTGLWQGFLYANGQRQNLGVPSGELQSFPLDINNNNQIVGSSDGSGWEQGNAILYDENGQWHNLNDLIPSDSGWHLLRAEAINDVGQIVGWGFKNGVNNANYHRAFLLTPGSSTPSDTTKPTITVNSPTECAAYKLGESVTADYSCSDDTSSGSDLSCTGSVADGSALDTSSVGPKTFTVTSTDKAGTTALTLLMMRLPKEEEELIERFGDEYREYAERTGRLFPRLR